jgi:hypothetical protein
MNARGICFAACFGLLSSIPAFAWDGTNSNTGSSVEIERGQLVRSGRTIEVYDSTEGYKEYDVDSIRRSGRTVEIEATDPATGESTTLEMDDD